MRQTKILLISVSAGSGHMRAAEAIKAYANRPGSNVIATHLDAMQFVSKAFRKLYTDFYLTLVHKAPALWGYLYQITHDAKPDSSMQQFRRGVERLNTLKLRKEIAKLEPDVIICTHFLPAEMLSRMLGKDRLDCPVWVQVTDFDLHRMWLHEHMSGYFAANEEVAYRMRAQGIAAHLIHVTGIPIMPAFAQQHSRSECAAEQGLDPKRMTFLLMGGGAGLGSLDSIAARLLALKEDFQLIGLAGDNTATLAALQNLAQRYPQRMVAHAYTDKIERLMACADVIITKPGGLTSSECLAMGLPMIINAPIPGQEERNADYLLEQGVALKAFDGVTLEYRVGYLLQHADKRHDMRNKARALGRADAAQRVLDVVLKRQPHNLC